LIETLLGRDVSTCQLSEEKWTAERRFERNADNFCSRERKRHRIQGKKRKGKSGLSREKPICLLEPEERMATKRKTVFPSSKKGEGRREAQKGVLRKIIKRPFVQRERRKENLHKFVSSDVEGRERG